ncbi:hypothetical protein RAMLITH_01090 [Ramlibacter sp. RBP-2]|uniref:Uncharacterized protein n=1 Tax=Ramlibacter lithotrophicus TaxID=2606681 RepID=A0A7X6DC54_9BURK|nr:hypothetical protein [Ramlibacter lithotrophicus]NKE64402.1 hypothetical protein [Ramlibacter lithotrophicus]
MDGTSRSGEWHDGSEAKDLGRDVRAMAPASGEGSQAALEMWKRRERARALLNAREPRRFRSDTRSRRDGDRPG